MNKKLSAQLERFRSPIQIQDFVSAIPYNPDDYCRSAERVFLERKAHCLEGALLAAVALEKFGHSPQLLHLRSHRDDDHVVALFQQKGLWGAIGKSNTTLLKWREPVYRDVESLAMSYFPFYFNSKGQMSLIAWAGPIDLNRYEKKWKWRSGPADVSDMGASFYNVRAQKVMTIDKIETLPKAPASLVKACFLGANKKGLYCA
jgi:hypothetical protein